MQYQRHNVVLNMCTVVHIQIFIAQFILHSYVIYLDMKNQQHIQSYCIYSTIRFQDTLHTDSSFNPLTFKCGTFSYNVRV